MGDDEPQGSGLDIRESTDRTEARSPAQRPGWFTGTEWRTGCGGGGETLRCPLAAAPEYLGLPKMTGQRVSEDKGLGAHGSVSEARGRRGGWCLRGGSLQVPCSDTEGKWVTGRCQRDAYTGRQTAGWRTWEPRTGCLVKSQEGSLGGSLTPDLGQPNLPGAPNPNPSKGKKPLPHPQQSSPPHSSLAPGRSLQLREDRHGWVQREDHQFRGEGLPLHYEVPLASPARIRHSNVLVLRSPCIHPPAHTSGRKSRSCAQP